MGKILAVCSSETKGTVKNNIISGIIKEDFGLVGDAHADCTTNRQISLLAVESMNKMKGMGIEIEPGLFAENLTTEGIELLSLPIGTKIAIGNEVKLVISQIGKECHAGCAIFKQVGKCIMPKEGVFATVIHGGSVSVGDDIRVIEDGE
jgi:MOSC domain-containing protein YiiM